MAESIENQNTDTGPDGSEQKKLKNDKPLMLEGHQDTGAEGAAEDSKRIESALKKIEEEDGSDPVLKSEWVKKAKKFIVGSGKAIGSKIPTLLTIVGTMFFSLLRGAFYAPVKLIDLLVKDAMKKGGAPDVAKKFVDYKPYKKEKK